MRPKWRFWNWFDKKKKWRRDGATRPFFHIGENFTGIYAIMKPYEMKRTKKEERMENFIEMKDVSFAYKINGLESLTAVDHVSLSIPKASHIAILGRNGSGKSTLARLINGLETPTEGEIIVDGILLTDEGSSWKIRKKCGIVFQNPDNQIIGTTVEEDVAFGPENLGMPREEMIGAIDEALRFVGLLDKKTTAPHLLSGGQKQKLAIAGILAMSPECCILDEATSMLDPSSRQELMRLVGTLVKDRKMTVINITHHMEEAIQADYVYVMSEGAIVREGLPQDVFDETALLRAEGLDVPVHIEVAQKVAEKMGIERLPKSCFTTEDAINEIERICREALQKGTLAAFATALESRQKAESKADSEAESEIEPQTATEPQVILSVSGLSYTYSKETIFACDALTDVSFEIHPGEFFGIIGQTGSGKSTLVQHFNGLIRPQTGKVLVMGNDTAQKSSVRAIRKKVGLLFQYPEHQLFEETVYQDIAFGPKCLGKEEEAIAKDIAWAIKIVGLDETILRKSPFELSGGQKRRVAIAGIVVMKPEVLILDEPAAGLDPAGREEILQFMKDLCQIGTTVVLVSHNMDDVARLADRILVLKGGEKMICAAPEEVFENPEKTRRFGVSLPILTEFMLLMKTRCPSLDTSQFTAQSCADAIIRAFYKDRLQAGDKACTRAARGKEEAEQ